MYISYIVFEKKQIDQKKQIITYNNMKKHFLLILLLASVLQSAKAQNYDFSAMTAEGETLYYKITDIDNHYVSVVPPTGSSWTGYTKPTGSVTIPSSVTNGGTTYSVTAIGNDAFYKCSSLTSATIPTSVTSIGNTVFFGCTSFASLAIPASVTSIGSQVFTNCPSLATMTVEEGNTIYDSRNNCNALIETATNTLIAGTKNTVIPNTVTSIGERAFRGSTGLTSINIPNSVAVIEDMAFYGCSSLESVAIPNSVTSIGGSAFLGCSGLTSLTIGNSVAVIGDMAFLDCSGLTSLTIGNSVTSIGDMAFYDCSSLSHLIVPDSVITIGRDAFNGVDTVYYRGGAEGSPWGAGVVITTVYEEEGDPLVYESPYKTTVIDCNTAATNVIIPNSVTTIGGSAFQGCSSLTSLTIGNSVTKIGDKAFQDCSSLTSLTIGNSVTTIGNNAFRDCSSLESVAIPNSVAVIGRSAFLGCSGLTSVTIGSSVTTIGNNAFRDCSSLPSINIPDRVTSIGEGTFYGCTSLASLAIPNLVTSIGDFAFWGCRSLTSVTIGNSVTTIGSDAFADCINVDTLYYNAKNLTTIENSEYRYGGFRPMRLQTLVIGDSVETLPKGVFYGQSNVDTLYYNAKNLTTTAEWYNTSDEYNDYGFRPMRLQTLVIGDSVETLPKGVFYGQNGLASVTIGKSVTTIEDGVFVGCGNVDTLYYNAENLATTAEWYNTSDEYNDYGFRPMRLQTLVIGDSVETLPKGVFYGQDNVDTLVYNARNLTNTVEWYSVGSENDIYGFRPMAFRTLVIGDSVETLPKGAFYNSDITSVDIPNSVTTIDFKAFYGCSSLERVEIPNSVTKIGDKAFQDCTSLTRADIGSGLKTLGTNVFTGCSSMDTLYYNAKQLNANSWNYDDEYGFHTVGLQVLKIGDSVRTIPQYAFYGQDSLTSVEIPGSVTSIGKYAFCRCSGLDSLTLPESITSISEAAFSGCSSLTGVTIPNSLTSIDSYTFDGCSSLQSFVVPSTVTHINQYAFLDCTSLKTIYNLSELDIVKGDDTYGRVAYYANRVVTPARSGTGANTLYQIPESYSFVADEDGEEMNIPRVTIPNIDNLIYKDGTTWKAKKIVLTDDTSRFSAPVAFTADSAVYIREFTNGNRSTLYLPFSAAVPAGFEVYDFADFSDDVIRFAPHEGDIAAYTPYLVGYDLAKDGSSTPCHITATNAVFPKSETASYHPVTKNGLTFQGAIERTQMSTDNYGYSNGYFVRSGGNAHVNPFRCYFSATGSAPASTLMVDILDGSVGIDAVEEAPESDIRYSNDVYDMMGRLVRKDAEDLRGLPQGIYIWRGKKVFTY